MKVWTCPTCKAKSEGERYCSPECRLRFYSDQVGDCWIWNGRVQGSTKQGLLFWNRTAWHVPTYVALVAGITRKRGEKHSQTCGNRLCVNPAHATVSTEYISGVRTLDVEQALAIRESQQDAKTLASLYGVSSDHIRKIKHGKSWGAAITRFLNKKG